MMMMLRGDHDSYNSLRHRMMMMLMMNDDDDSDDGLRYQIRMTMILITQAFNAVFPQAPLSASRVPYTPDDLADPTADEFRSH